MITANSSPICGGVADSSHLGWLRLLRSITGDSPGLWLAQDAFEGLEAIQASTDYRANQRESWKYHCDVERGRVANAAEYRSAVVQLIKAVCISSGMANCVW